MNSGMDIANEILGFKLPTALPFNAKNKATLKIESAVHCLNRSGLIVNGQYFLSYGEAAQLTESQRKSK